MPFHATPAHYQKNVAAQLPCFSARNALRVNKNRGGGTCYRRVANHPYESYTMFRNVRTIVEIGMVKEGC